MTDFDPALEIERASVAVRQAARVCRSVQAALVTAETLEKKDKSPVTVADFASQAVVCQAIAAGSAVPRVVGEESAKELRADDQAPLRAQITEHVRGILGSEITEDDALRMIDLGGVDPADTDGRYWTLDPIDGTKGFLRNQHYAIALGFIDRGELRAAVLACPRLAIDGGEGALLTAVRGEGARIAPLFEDGPAEPIRVHDVARASEARFCESVEAAHSDHSWAGQIANKLGITSESVRMDSQAKYAAVARGDASIYLRLPTKPGYQEKIWDHAAGALVVEEAGGKLTDVDGKPLDFSRGRTLAGNRGVIAASAGIFDEVLAAVRGAEPSA